MLIAGGIHKRDKGDVVIQHDEAIFGCFLDEGFEPLQLRFGESTVVTGVTRGITIHSPSGKVLFGTGVVHIVEHHKKHVSLFKGVVIRTVQSSPGVGLVGIGTGVEIDIVISDDQPLWSANGRSELQESIQQTEVVTNNVSHINDTVAGGEVLLQKVIKNSIPQKADLLVGVGLGIAENGTGKRIARCTQCTRCSRCSRCSRCAGTG